MPNAFRALLLAAFLMPSSLLAQTSTLAATPPMGWNSWNLFAGRVTDKNVRHGFLRHEGRRVRLHKYR
jgi:alpha-galactosidase